MLYNFHKYESFIRTWYVTSIRLVFSLVSTQGNRITYKFVSSTSGSSSSSSHFLHILSTCSPCKHNNFDNLGTDEDARCDRIMEKQADSLFTEYLGKTYCKQQQLTQYYNRGQKKLDSKSNSTIYHSITQVNGNYLILLTCSSKTGPSQIFDSERH